MSRWSSRSKLVGVVTHREVRDHGCALRAVTENVFVEEEVDEVCEQNDMHAVATGWASTLPKNETVVSRLESCRGGIDQD